MVKKEITNKIVERVPRGIITNVDYEGPRIAIYTTKPKFLLTNSFIIADIVNTVKKRIVVRTDEKIRKDPEKAREMILEASPQEAEVVSTFFDKTLGEVIVEARYPRFLKPEHGFDPIELTEETGWIVKVRRYVEPNSNSIQQIYYALKGRGKRDERKRILREIGESIFRERLLNEEEVSLIALGGFKEVGRSCMLVTTSESKIMLDCGINLASKRPIDIYPRLDWIDFDFDELDGVIISHAHLDHSGFLPMLFKYGYKGPVYCTEPTLPLMILLFTDMIKVAQAEGKEPIFDMKDVREVVKHCITLSYNTVTDISPDVKLVLNNAGHILGSSSIHLHIGEGKYNIVYTGDFKFGRTMLLESASWNYIRAETLVIESTYGAREDIMPSRQEAERELIDGINATLKEGGRVLIPVPAVGRAQEIMLILDKYMREGEILEVPIFLEGMLAEATALHVAYPKYLSRELRQRIAEDGDPFSSEYFTIVDHPRKRGEVLLEKPAIIMATSGMLEGGPILEYFKEIAQEEESKLIFVSYQVQGTLGRRMLDGSRQASLLDENGKIRIIDVKCKVEKVDGFSGHSDYNQLIKFVAKLRPKVKRVVVAHGERRKAEGLAQSVSRIFRLPSVAPSVNEALRLY